MSRMIVAVVWVSLWCAMVFVSGCGRDSIMRPVAKASIVSRGEAMVVFIRPSRFGGRVGFELWDEEELVGVLSPREIIQYSTAPGEHLFLARADNWSYVKADLKPGRTYFIVCRAYPVVWTTRVALDPVTKSDEILEKQLGDWMQLATVEVIPYEKSSFVDSRLKSVRRAIEKLDEAEYAVLRADDNR